MIRKIGRTTMTLAAAALVGTAVYGSAGAAQVDSTAVTPPANDSPRQDTILSVVPDSALAVLAVNDISDVDTKFGRLLNRMVIPVKPAMLAKGWLQIVAGVDDRGPLALVVMPARASEPARPGLALLIPTADRKTLVAFLDPRPIDEGLMRITLRGRESFAGSKGGFTVIANDLSIVKAIVAEERPLAARISPAQQRLWATEDVTLWLDPAKLRSGELRPPKTSTAWSLLSSDALVAWMTGLQASLSFQSAGVSLKLLFEGQGDVDPEAFRQSKGTLLSGLPDEPYVLAMGMTEPAAAESKRRFATTWASAAVAMGVVKPDRSDELTQMLELSLGHSGSATVSVSLLPQSDSSGTVALAKIVRAKTEPQALLANIDAVGRFLKSGPFVDARFNLAAERLQYRRAVESTQDVSVDHWVLDTTKLEGVDVESIKRVVGDEGVLFRLGSVDNEYLVITLGGGLQRFKGIIDSLRAERTPLTSDVGTMMAALGVPRRRFLEAYISVERSGRLINLLGGVFPALPTCPDIADVNVPIALAAHRVGPAAVQLDLFFPTELLLAVKSALVKEPAKTR